MNQTTCILSSFRKALKLDIPTLRMSSDFVPRCVLDYMCPLHQNLTHTHTALPPLLLQCSSSELPGKLSPRLWSSVHPKQNSTHRSHALYMRVCFRRHTLKVQFEERWSGCRLLCDPATHSTGSRTVLNQKNFSSLQLFLQ